MNAAPVRAMLVLILLVIPSMVFAKIPPKIEKVVFSQFVPALSNPGIISAYTDPDPAKMRTYVVIERGGIPAERATFFISWSDYDYRGAVINLAKNDRITTRRGGVYTYLQKGDVMAVTGVRVFGSTVYVKLLSADVYRPEAREKDKRFARVSVEVGFKFPKEVFKTDDADTVIKTMLEWFTPFSSRDEAFAYAETIGGNTAEIAGQEWEQLKAEERAAREARRKRKASTAVGDESPADAAAAEHVEQEGQRKQVKKLDEKIEALQRQMEENAAEMERLKQEMKANAQAEDASPKK